MVMHLTEQLAQEIVDRTMSILPYNINVMDDEGKIIGSGDRKRLLTKHEGACEVLRRRQTIEIGRDDTLHWDGVREGMNLPILFQGEILGVVGITGDPEEIRGYGELVKMTTEMIIEQAFLQKQIQLDERIKEEFVHQLINGKDLDENLFYEKAKSLQVDLTIPRVVLLIKGVMKELEQTRKLQLMINDIIDEDDLSVTTYTGEVVIVKKVYVENDQWKKERTLNTLKIWLSQLKKVDSLIKIAIGDHYPIVQLYQSFIEAKETMVVGEKLAPEQAIFDFDEFAIYVFMNKLAKEIDNNPFLALINKLKSDDRLGELQKTLEVYINENGKAINTAEKLFIHRNSLQYRLEKIKEVTGKDPRNHKDLFELYLSLIMNAFISGDR